MNQIKFNKQTCPTAQSSLLDLHTHKKNTLVTPHFESFFETITTLPLTVILPHYPTSMCTT